MQGDRGPDLKVIAFAGDLVETQRLQINDLNGILAPMREEGTSAQRRVSGLGEEGKSFVEGMRSVVGSDHRSLGGR